LEEEESNQESEESDNEEKEESGHKAEEQAAKPHVHPHSVKRVTVGETSVSYILKFFFSLMFIFVSLGSLYAIANMENKKDTLLYAKFIADVGR